MTIAERLGTYEHFYDAADVPVNTGKHYVATAFVVDAPDEDLEPEAQHEDLRRFEAIPEDAHEYVAVYLEDAGFDRDAM